MADKSDKGVDALVKEWMSHRMPYLLAKNLALKGIVPKAVMKMSPEEIAELPISDKAKTALSDLAKGVVREFKGGRKKKTVEEPEQVEEQQAEPEQAEETEPEEAEPEEPEEAEPERPGRKARVSTKKTEAAKPKVRGAIKEKIKAILAACDKADRNVVIGVASDMMDEIDYGRTSTPFAALNTGMTGGFPRGKFSSIYGPEQTAKSTLCLQTIAHDQAEDPNAVWLIYDAENAFDAPWAQTLGVDLTRLVIIEPIKNFEDTLDVIRDIILTGQIKGVVVDSLGAVSPWQETQKKRDDKGNTKSIGEDTMAILARTLGKAHRVLTPLVRQFKVTWIWITHVYTPIGERFPRDIPKGGNAFKHFGHMRLHMSRRKGKQETKRAVTMPDGRVVELYTAYEVVIKVDKTRQGATEGYAMVLPFVFGKGLSEIESIIDMAFTYGVFDIKGAYYGHPAFEEHVGSAWIQGRENVIQALRSKPDLFAEITQVVGELIAKSSESQTVFDAETGEILDPEVTESEGDVGTSEEDGGIE